MRATRAARGALPVSRVNAHQGCASSDHRIRWGERADPRCPAVARFPGNLEVRPPGTLGAGRPIEPRCSGGSRGQVECVK